MTTGNDVFAGLMLLGSIVIYIPQFVKLYKKRTAHGFSATFMMLGHASAFMAMTNAFIYYINSCGIQDCAEGFMGLGVIIVQWFLYFLQYLALVVLERKYDSHLSGKLKIMSLTFVVSNALCLVFLIATLAVLGKNDWKNDGSPDLQELSDATDIIISIFFLSHYLPQIYRTYRLQAVGSMSLITLGMMCPGTFVWSIFLAIQGETSRNKRAGDPSVWLPYLVVGFMQLILLIMGTYYDRKIRKKYQILNLSGENSSDSEETILIVDE